MMYSPISGLFDQQAVRRLRLTLARLGLLALGDVDVHGPGPDDRTVDIGFGYGVEQGVEHAAVLRDQLSLHRVEAHISGRLVRRAPRGV